MRLHAFARLARPRQWIKNTFVLPGLIFGHALESPDKVTAALVATLAFCLMSSAVYAMNDVCDCDRDREHPDKRTRPIASGEIGVREAIVFAILLAVAALALGLRASPAVAGILAGYAVLNLAYSLGLKRIPVVDVFIIAAGFMLRILAGTLGIGIAPSRWLLLCGFLVTLFLGFAKRRAELIRLADDAGQHRPVLDAYNESFLDAAILVCAAGTLGAYAVYTVAPDTIAQHGTDLTLTVPFVMFGTFRYLFLLRHRGGGGDPSNELLDDRWLLGSAAGWAATVVLLIG
ncbi:MAG: decaprenyl-phosphate phosphoribosyltransferase [Betaproteobacteria bacterium]